MKEKILIFENGLDDRAVEAHQAGDVKVALKSTERSLKGLFLRQDGKPGIWLYLFVKDTGEPYPQNHPWRPMRVGEVAKRYSGQSVPPAGFLRNRRFLSAKKPWNLITCFGG